MTPYKIKVREDIKEAVEEMKKIKEGKLKARNAEDLFNGFKRLFRKDFPPIVN